MTTEASPQLRERILGKEGKTKQRPVLPSLGGPASDRIFMIHAQAIPQFVRVTRELGTPQLHISFTRRVMRKIRNFLLGIMLVAIFTVVASYYVSLGFNYLRAKTLVLYDSFLESVTRVRVQYVPSTQLPLPDLISHVAREYKLPAVVLQAIVLEESSGGNSHALYNFEPKVFAARATKDFRFQEDERRMLSSSHGITHIMGYRAEPDCGVHWSKLYDPAVALNCTAKIMRENLARFKGDSAARLAAAYRVYNGTGPDAEMYSKRVMARVGELLFKQLKEDI